MIVHIIDTHFILLTALKLSEIDHFVNLFSPFLCICIFFVSVILVHGFFPTGQKWLKVMSAQYNWRWEIKNMFSPSTQKNTCDFDKKNSDLLTFEADWLVCPSCVTVVFPVLKLNSKAIKSTNESLCLLSSTIDCALIVCVCAQIDDNEKETKINYSGDNNIDRRRTLDSLSFRLFVRVFVVCCCALGCFIF